MIPSSVVHSARLIGIAVLVESPTVCFSRLPFWSGFSRLIHMTTMVYGLTLPTVCVTVVVGIIILSDGTAVPLLACAVAL